MILILFHCEYLLCSAEVQISSDRLSGIGPPKVQSCALHQHTAVCAGLAALQHLPLRARGTLPVKTLLQGCLEGERHE